MSRSPVVERVRRRLAGRGFVPAGPHPPAAEGRAEEYRLARSRLVEDPILRSRPVGDPTPWPDPVAFLDGVQRYEVVGTSGGHPVVVAELGAAVRLREGKEVHTVERAERRILVGSPEVLDQAAPAAPECEPILLDAEDPGRLHPLRALELARQVIDRERGRLERDVGVRFRRWSAAWVVVDGVLTDSDVWTRDPRAVGVSKSHATLPFDGPELVTYLELPVGCRSSVFEPATWRITPVRSWGLRLWPWEGIDLLHGLVRVEVAELPGVIERADELSRWILAERAPLSRPNPRWDRLLYGIAAVERHLRR